MKTVKITTNRITLEYSDEYQMQSNLISVEHLISEALRLHDACPLDKVKSESKPLKQTDCDFLNQLRIKIIQYRKLNGNKNDLTMDGDYADHVVEKLTEILKDE